MPIRAGSGEWGDKGGLALATRPPLSPHYPLPARIVMHLGRVWRISLRTAAVENQKTAAYRGVQPRALVIRAALGGGMEERLNPLDDVVAARPHGEMEGGASLTVHPNRCVSSAFGKCALITADGGSFFRSIEHCASWLPKILL